jgi:hypothetical protein
MHHHKQETCYDMSQLTTEFLIKLNRMRSVGRSTHDEEELIRNCLLGNVEERILHRIGLKQEDNIKVENNV